MNDIQFINSKTKERGVYVNKMLEEGIGEVSDVAIRMEV